MSSIVQQFNPATSSSTTFTAPQSASNGVLVFFNESNVCLELTFADGSSMYLPAWYHRHKCGSTGSVNITWAVNSTLTSSNPPISLIVVEAYAAGEHYPADGPLVRQANVGNQVTTNVGSTTSLMNDGSAPGTSIIEATPSDAGASTWTADNSGNLTIKGDNAGTLTTLLQLIAGASPAVKLAAAGIIAEVLGGLKVDGTLESVGAATMDGTLAVTGTSTFSGDATFNGTGNGVSVAHNLSVTGSSSLDNGAISTNGSGAATLNSNLTVKGSSSLDNGNITSSGAGTLTIGQSVRVQANVDLGNASSAYVPSLFIDGSNNLCLQSEGSATNINMQDSTGAVIGTFKLDQSAAATINSAGSLTIGKVFFNIGGIKDLNKGQFAASGTYNHGLSGTPTIVLLCPSSSGSTWTFGAYTFTSTQFTALINSALNTNWYAYR